MSKADILTNDQISAEIINLISSSKEYCFLVTPYYKPWPLLNRALEKAAKLEKKIVFILRYDSAKKIEVKDLENFGFDIHLVEKLHSKLYLNEHTVIISSMNLYDVSKEFNYEVGYKINSGYEAKRFFQEVIEKDILAISPKISVPGRYAEHIKERVNKRVIKSSDNSHIQQINRNLPSDYNKRASNSYSGYCISCSSKIKLDPNKPFCFDCYSDLGSQASTTFISGVCHRCGINSDTSIAKPLCYDCWDKMNKRSSL